MKLFERGCSFSFRNLEIGNNRQELRSFPYQEHMFSMAPWLPWLDLRRDQSSGKSANYCYSMEWAWQDGLCLKKGRERRWPIAGVNGVYTVRYWTCECFDRIHWKCYGNGIHCAHAWCWVKLVSCALSMVHKQISGCLLRHPRFRWTKNTGSHAVWENISACHFKVLLYCTPVTLKCTVWLKMDICQRIPLCKPCELVFKGPLPPYCY